MNILIYGICGAMGKVLNGLISESEDTVACGVDKFADPTKFSIPVYSSCNDINEKVDCIIDFSVRAGIYDYLPYAIKNSIPCVIATTGYNAEEQAYIENAAKEIPILKSGNMSLGINLLLNLAKTCAKALGSFADIEIIEQHHHNKIDAPSGTALLLADGIRSVLPEKEYTYGRHGQIGKRSPNEIGIHAVRGGSIVGKHEIMFVMDNEIVTIKHELDSKSVLASGSIKAAHFLATQKIGLYNMQDLFE